MAVLTTYDQVGVAESVEDIIYDISPSDTPFHSLVRNETVNARTFEWIEDALTASAANAEIEGFQASDDTLTTPTTRSNVCQIMSKTINVSATADVIKTYGRAAETAYQLAKELKSIKKDYERAMVGVSNAAVAGNASTAREMASVDQMITGSTDAGANATDPLTEAAVNTAGQAAYTAGSNPDTLMIKPADSLLVAGFATAANKTRTFNDDTTTFVNVIEVLVTPFGTYRVVLNREMLSTQALLIDPSMFRTVTLRPFTRTLLAKQGDNDRHLLVGEVSVKHVSFADSHKIVGLS